jgi:[histone H3]-dimethyl-L-lysine9 demethylase
LLQAELEHETKPDLVRCRRDPDVRDTCGELA